MPKTLKRGYFIAKSFLILILAMGATGCEKRSAQISRCVDNLHHIEILKIEWANEKGKSSNDFPNWGDLRPYFPGSWSNNLPVCPDGGIYAINRIGELPTCSIGGPGHSLPPR